MKTEDKKIAVIGIGGVGGYVAGMLAKAYPHVTMVARGARGESIRKNGLVLHSDYKGEIVAKPERVVPVREMGQQDYIFICVKNYSLEDVCENIRDMVTDDTVIIPVMNGVDPGGKDPQPDRKGNGCGFSDLYGSFCKRGFFHFPAGYFYLAVHRDQKRRSGAAGESGPGSRDPEGRRY